jgi:hypothetical protein
MMCALVAVAKGRLGKLKEGLPWRNHSRQSRVGERLELHLAPDETGVFGKTGEVGHGKVDDAWTSGLPLQRRHLGKVQGPCLPEVRGQHLAGKRDARWDIVGRGGGAGLGVVGERTWFSIAMSIAWSLGAGLTPASASVSAFKSPGTWRWVGVDRMSSMQKVGLVLLGKRRLGSRNEAIQELPPARGETGGLDIGEVDLEGTETLEDGPARRVGLGAGKHLGTNGQNAQRTLITKSNECPRQKSSLALGRASLWRGLPPGNR